MGQNIKNKEILYLISNVTIRQCENYSILNLSNQNLLRVKMSYYFNLFFFCPFMSCNKNKPQACNAYYYFALHQKKTDN